MRARLVVILTWGLVTFWIGALHADSIAPKQAVGFSVIQIPSEEPGNDQSITLALWYPTRSPVKPYVYGGPTRGMVAPDGEPNLAGGPWPLLIFSHGYGGCGLGSVFFTEALAAKGWVVAAPDHHDRFSAVRSSPGSGPTAGGAEVFRHAREIARSTPADRGAYEYRLNEIQRVFQFLVSKAPYRNWIDPEKVAVGGHSFGGFTALGLCGTLPARQERSIKGLLLFSTGSGGYLYDDQELARVRMPVMLFMGEREGEQMRGAHTMTSLSARIFHQVAGPKYFLEVKDGTHFSFNVALRDTWGAKALSGSLVQFEVIARYAVAFLECHVARRGDPDRILETRDPGVTRFIRKP